MNILDENIPENQRQLLRSWRIRTRQIGHDSGRQGMQDEEIIPLIHQLGSVTFFTRDLGFYRRQLCHASYCLVILAVDPYEVASLIRRFLRHTMFNTQRKRLGKIVRVSHIGIEEWKLHSDREERQSWAT